jgi:hypothetical protein
MAEQVSDRQDKEQAMKKAALVFAFLMILPCLVSAQEQYLELLRTDLKVEKTAILTENLGMADAESQIFWPIYREYDLKLSALQDERLVLIKEYAEAYETMGEEVAMTITEKALKLQEQRLKLRKDYFKKVAKAVNPIVASRFAHLENMIGNLVDLQVQAQIPLAPRNPVEDTGEKP